MDKILVSACLLGQPVRYDAGAKPSPNAHLARWQLEGRLLAFCPEVAGGFSTPRLPAEIEAGTSARDVLDGRARIMASDGVDVTGGFLDGARAALLAAQSARCRHAILMDGSPSCGTGFIYAGRFDSRQKAGMGVTAALLTQHGIKVWSEAAIDDLAAILGAL
ncbi:MAG: DUF523 domain-containing protein [Marinosulfonomonas sp.]|nr:DUF523 domain-containing protein [Marinosulfonomonas sp.]